MFDSSDEEQQQQQQQPLPQGYNDAALRFNFGGKQFDGVEEVVPEAAKDYSGYHGVDIRPKQRTVKLSSRDNDLALQDKLIDIILNHKKDIRFAPSAEYRAGAERYAKANNLTLGPEGEDINDDGVKDVILYNKAGVPVVINGYHVKPSKMPFRKMYKEAYPKATDRLAVGGYDGYMNKLWGATPTVDEATGDVTFPFDKTGKREVKHSSKDLPEAFKPLKEKGWRIPQAPRRELSFYQVSMKILSNTLNGKIASAVGYFSNRTWARKCIPPLQLNSCIYSIIIDSSLIEATPALKALITSAPTPKDKWEALQQYKRDHSKALKQLYERNQAQLLETLKKHAINVARMIFNNDVMSNDQVIARTFDADYDKITSKVVKATLKANTKEALINIINVAKDAFINSVH